MSDEIIFLGEKVPFWLELKKRANTLDVQDLLRDIAALDAKVSFYERELKRIQQFMEIHTGGEA